MLWRYKNIYINPFYATIIIFIYQMQEHTFLTNFTYFGKKFVNVMQFTLHNIFLILVFASSITWP